MGILFAIIDQARRGTLGGMIRLVNASPAFLKIAIAWPVVSSAVLAHICHGKRCWPLPQLLPRGTKHARAAQALVCHVCARVVDEPHKVRLTVCHGEADRV